MFVMFQNTGHRVKSLVGARYETPESPLGLRMQFKKLRMQFKKTTRIRLMALRHFEQEFDALVMVMAFNPNLSYKIYVS